MYDVLPVKRKKETFDVLVIGCGLAGITAAFRAADAGVRVLLITKTQLCSGSSFYGLMDTIHCQATIDENDETVFLEDILACSARMNDTWMNQYYIRNIRSCISYLKRMGIAFEKLPEPKLPCFGTHAHDLYFWKDWKQIRTSVRARIEAHPNITLAEDTELIALLQQSSGAICGACFYRKNTRTYEAITAKSVILATGGFGGLYKHNLNSPDVCGDGQALALKAGASLINLEFNQFIPGFISPGYKIVFREGSLDYCSGLFDSSQTNVLRQYFSSDEEMGHCLKKRALHGPFTTADKTGEFDLALFDAALKSCDNGVEICYRPEILLDPRSYVRDYISWLHETFDITLSKDTIKIAPFFHAANGGIFVDHTCQSTIPGLFACGECAGGIHGADRLGGNASGSCLVFGTLAAISAAAYASQTSIYSLSESELQTQLHRTYLSDHTIASENLLSPEAITLKVKDLMWKYCNVQRNQSDLDFVRQEIQTLRQKFFPWKYLFSSQESVLKAALCAEHALTLSEALALAMSQRKESRGGHYRSDFPLTDPAWEKRIVISIQNGTLHSSFSPCMDRDFSDAVD
ncbi:MAG: FAD-binding protein [Lachnospiraceae bacterium]